jgi:tellurite resistance protein
MDPQEIYFEMWGRFNWLPASYNYWIDACQRAILFTDILRKRGNGYFEHIKAGQPPVLVFDYEMVLDGRTLKRPVNYAIVHILDRREGPVDRRATTGKKPNATRVGQGADRRADASHRRIDPPHPERRPIVVIDPRAGHGPGIGGSKLDSQIGVALNAGHPVYFVTFFPEPEPGQTLADVQRAEVKFLEEVMRRHPDAEAPAVIGNCQAGWATALIGADRPDVTGPMVFNGSPLSYWGGVDGANPIRYRGGLCGGVWPTSLLCDLGNGTFDGANLVANFESLNPANTLWNKQYNLWANIDTEEARYLNFEKWWGGFFKMTRDEIHFIVDSLFVGNELEQGRLQLEKDHWINLKNFKDPIVVFASAGDNITPPQQALNWIYKVYRTVDEIKRSGQVIVYILHPKIGHLGIFVGSRVARKEHSAIIGTVDMIEYLSPGLYEMVITGEPSKPWLNDHKVEFVERTMEDILQLDAGLQDEAAFCPVAAVSRFNDKLYLTFVSPWVRMLMTEETAELLRQLHPLRSQRYMLSDKNPLMWPFDHIGRWVRAHRRPVEPDNPFLKWEKWFSTAVQSSLNSYRDLRDRLQERLFKRLYDNSWMKTLFPEENKTTADETTPVGSEQNAIERDLWLRVMEKGGFEAAVVRIILAVANVNHRLDRREYAVAHRILQTNDRLKHLKPADLKRLVKEQAGIVAYDKGEAVRSLSALLPQKSDRIEAFEIANSVATADMELDQKEKDLLAEIQRTLKL